MVSLLVGVGLLAAASLPAAAPAAGGGRAQLLCGLGGHTETDERPETETETANGGQRRVRSDKTGVNPTETRYR